MKNLFATLLAVMLCFGFAQRGISQDDKKHKAEAGADSSGYRKFRADAEKKIKENEKKIADLKTKKQDATQEVKDKYNKKVADLEQKNMDLKKRINDYTYDNNNSRWNQFKREFNHDMDELGKAMKDLGKDNVK